MTAGQIVASGLLFKQDLTFMLGNEWIGCGKGWKGEGGRTIRGENVASNLSCIYSTCFSFIIIVTKLNWVYIMIFTVKYVSSKLSTFLPFPSLYKNCLRPSLIVSSSST